MQSYILVYLKNLGMIVTNSGAELQKMQYGEYQILIVPTHLPIGVNFGGG
jgi:hypothetical protein